MFSMDSAHRQQRWSNLSKFPMDKRFLGGEMDDVIIIPDSSPKTSKQSYNKPNYQDLNFPSQQAMMWEKENLSCFYNTVKLFPTNIETNQLISEKYTKNLYVVDDWLLNSNGNNNTTSFYENLENNVIRCNSQATVTEKKKSTEVALQKPLLNPKEIPTSAMKFEGSKEDFVDLTQESPSANSVSDDDDVIFVRAYVKTENAESNSELSNEPVRNAAKENGQKSSSRPRKNTKREPEGCEDRFHYEKCLKDKKTYKKLGNAKNSRQKSNRRSTRQLAKCGAIYRPPIPLSRNHLRSWPVDGMHERPEYNSTTGKIEKFDYTVRSIVHNYKKCKTAEERISNNVDEIVDDMNLLERREMTKNTSKLPKLCHEVMHAVMAYIVSSQSVPAEKEEKDEKTMFMEGLQLQKISDRTENAKVKIENICSSHRNLRRFQMELLENCVVLYCLTNNIEQTDMAKYLDSLSSEDCVKWCNENLRSH